MEHRSYNRVFQISSTFLIPLSHNYFHSFSTYFLISVRLNVSQLFQFGMVNFVYRRNSNSGLIQCSNCKCAHFLNVYIFGGHLNSGPFIPAFDCHMLTLWFGTLRVRWTSKMFRFRAKNAQISHNFVWHSNGRSVQKPNKFSGYGRCRFERCLQGG